jgi:hypothetical protein
MFRAARRAALPDDVHRRRSGGLPGGGLVGPPGATGCGGHPAETGAKTADTLKAIVATRAGVPTTERMPFGVHAEVVSPGLVRVGDAVEVLD